MEPRWCSGTVVAISADKGLAVRYGKGRHASVAWHTTSGLCSRGCRPLLIKERNMEVPDSEANDDYQRLSTNMAQGCLLLRDQDEGGRDTCECHYCTEVRWPAEVGEWRSRVDAPECEATSMVEAGPVRGAAMLKSRQSARRKGAGRGQTETAKRGRADEGDAEVPARVIMRGVGNSFDTVLQAAIAAEKEVRAAQREEAIAKGGVDAGHDSSAREGEDGVNADMVEGMIVAAQQWEQELLMFDDEVTQAGNRHSANNGPDALTEALELNEEETVGLKGTLETIGKTVGLDNQSSIMFKSVSQSIRNR